MKRYSKIFLGLICILLLFVMSGCSSSKTPKIIRMASSASMGPPQGFVMVKKGFLEKEIGNKYEIESQVFLMPNSIFQGLYEEKYDLIFTQYPSLGYFSKNLYQKANYVLIANLGNGDPMNLLVNKNIKSIKELDGKTIGVMDFYYPFTVLLSQTLTQYGLNTVEYGGTVKIKYGQIMQIVPEFMQGHLDGIFIIPQVIPGCNSLMTYNDMTYHGAPAMCLMVRKKFLQENPQLVQEILEATIKSTEWTAKNSSEAANLVWEEMQKNGGGYLPYRQEDLVKLYKNTTWIVYPHENFLEEIWEYMKKTGKSPIPMEQVVDFTYLDKALTKNKMPSVKEYSAKLKANRE